MKKNKILWIAQTAVCLALLVVFQAVTKPMGTLVTGSAVNFILITATLVCGLWGGLIVALVSPFLAFLLGIVAMPIYLVPAIAVGNASLVVVYGLLLKSAEKLKGIGKYVTWLVTVAVAAVVKYGVLYGVIKGLIGGLINSLVEQALKTPAALFSTQQMITAAIGGALAMLVVPAVLKAIKK